MTRIASLLTLALAATPSFALAQQAAPAPVPTSAQPQAQTAAQTPARPAPAAAQPEETEDGPDIVVRGARQPGSVIGDIPPEQQLGPADIRSYGVGSVTELLTELGPQVRSDRGGGGAPVVLLDGRRISGFSEIRDLPTEAIARVDILPEEVALKYGYRADQKVVNFVLRRRFRAATVELSNRITTRGDADSPRGSLDLLKIARTGRLNLHLDYTAQSALSEDARGIVSTASPFSIPGNVVGVNGAPIDPRLSAGAGSSVTIAGVPGLTPTLGDFAGTAGNASVTDPGRYRTLLSSSRTFNANATYARSFGDVSGTLNGTFAIVNSDGLNGLPTVALTLPAGNRFSPFSNSVVVDRALNGDFGPLTQASRTITGHVGTVFNGTLGKWQWSLTGNYDRTDSASFSETGVDAGAFQARLNANDAGANPFGPLRAADIAPLAANSGFSTSNAAGVDLLLNGALLKLPAGDVSTSVRVGGDLNDFTSRSYRAGLTTSGKVDRNTASGQVNVDVPLTSRGRNVLAAIGSLSVNGNLAVDHLSDFGTLTTLGYGLNWTPVVPLRIIASVTERDTAPSQQQLGNPQILSPNVRVFDYVRGENAIVTTLSGGNPGLRKSSSHTFKLEANVKPWSDKDFTLTTNYIEARVDDPVAGFPAATAAIEAAFPTRFTRDNGLLTRIDTRPINFSQTSRSELRSGFNFSVPLKSKIQKQIEAFRAGRGPNPFAGLPIPPAAARFFGQGAGRGAVPAEGTAARGANGQGANGQGTAGQGTAGQATAGRGTAGQGTPAAAPAGGPPPAGGGRGGFGGGGFGGGGFGGGGGGRGGGGGGRLQFALYHTWHFTDRVLVQDGGPSLDLLRGDAIGGSGGQPRHELEGQAGYNNNGLGVRLSTNWSSATRVNGGTPGNLQSLRFSGLATADLRLFADLGQNLDLLRKHPWLRGTRVAFSLQNVFDSRRQVTDATGTTPIAYQPGYLDPLGRTVRLTVRKLFF